MPRHQPGKKRIPLRIKNVGKSGSRAAWRQLKGSEKCARGRWRSRPDHGRPCTPTNNFKSSEQRKPLKVLQKERMGNGHSDHIIDSKSWCSVQSIQADYNTLTNTWSPLSCICIHTQKESIFCEIKKPLWYILEVQKAINRPFTV